MRWSLDALIDVGGGACIHAFAMPDNPHAAGSAEMFARGHLDHLALNVADTEQFEGLRERLVAAGASDGLSTDFGMQRVVTFRDSDGFEAEITLWQDGKPIEYDRAVREPFVARGEDATGDDAVVATPFAHLPRCAATAEMRML